MQEICQHCGKVTCTETVGEAIRNQPFWNLIWYAGIGLFFFLGLLEEIDAKRIPSWTIWFFFLVYGGIGSFVIGRYERERHKRERAKIVIGDRCPSCNCVDLLDVDSPLGRETAAKWQRANSPASST